MVLATGKRQPWSKVTRLRIFRLSAPIVCAVWLSLCSSASATPSATGRDTWQRPDEVMDAMEARVGSMVHKLVLRVGSTGTVFAVDVQPAMVEDIRAWSVEEHLRQVIPVLGAENDPHLPNGQVDAVLVENAYHEMQEYDAMLRSFREGLKPGGRLVIIEPKSQTRSASGRVPEGTRHSGGARKG
jgi:SAM-dependent methyltransferase